MEKVKCPQCIADGTTSRVYQPEGRSTTLMGVSSFWDERGAYHHHDPNRSSSLYQCSLGHRWVREWGHPCPYGDFGGWNESLRFLDPVKIDGVLDAWQR